MDGEIIEIINTTERKVKEGEKELLTFLLKHDIDTLNRLLIIFNGPVKPSLIQVFGASVMGSALIGALVIDTILVSIDSFSGILMLFLIFISLYWAIHSFLLSRKKSLITQSLKLKSKQKILTLISFALRKKYEELT